MKCKIWDFLKTAQDPGAPGQCNVVENEFRYYCTNEAGHSGPHHAHTLYDCYLIWSTNVFADVAGAENKDEAPVEKTPSPNGVTEVSFVEQYLNADRIGGKAAGLYRLSHTCDLSVPEYAVLPVAVPPVRICVSPSAPILHRRVVSVRSGAPTSMPGMLKTKIPVRGPDRIIAAALEVYESWNAPEAVAYREANGIADTGTAVVIQVVPKNIVYSGVAFTSDPNHTHGTSFFPIVEAVEGLGTALVGGEKKGVEISLSDPRFATLFKALIKIHQNLGPSDVEWCAENAPDEPGGLKFWFLQHRALKFSKIPESDTAIPDGAEKLADLMPIGASSTAVIDSETFFYLTNFSPSEYTRMQKAAAIFVRNGSATCHAAIIARELGKPAFLLPEIVSATIYKATKSGEKLLVNGSSGAVYRVPPDFVPALVVEEKPKPPRRINNPNTERFVSSFVSIAPLMIDFYRSWENGDKGRVREYAEVIAGYLYLCVVAELRHVRTRADGDAYWKLTSAMKKISPQIVAGFGIKARDKFISSFLPELPPEKKCHVVSLSIGYFTKMSWYGSYGGKKWAVIATHLLRWMTGRLSDALFLDGVFNLKHNSCLVFNKLTNLTIGLSRGDEGLMALLDLKQSCGLTFIADPLRIVQLVNEAFCPIWSDPDALGRHQANKPVQAYWPFINAAFRNSNREKLRAGFPASELKLVVDDPVEDDEEQPPEEAPPQILEDVEDDDSVPEPAETNNGAGSGNCVDETYSFSSYPTTIPVNEESSASEATDEKIAETPQDSPAPQHSPERA